MRTSSSKSFDVPFTSAAHGLFTIEIGSCLVRLDFPGTGGQTPRISVNTWPRVYLQLHEKIYTPLTGVPTCSRVYLPSTTRFLRIAHGCALQYCRRLGGDNWFSEMSGSGVDDWEEAPAELEPPQDGWPWQLALCRVFECQQAVTPAASRSSAQNVVGHQQGSLKRPVSRRTSVVSLLEARLEEQTSVVLARISYLSKSLDLWARLQQPWTHQ